MNPSFRTPGGFILISLLLSFGGSLTSSAELKVIVDHNDNEHAAAGFKFMRVPAPSKTDAATHAKFRTIAGTRDESGGGLEKLHDGGLPIESDQPGENFFFDAGTGGGRLLVDLGKQIEIQQVNTYSWHPTTRGPQLYKLYAGAAESSGGATNEVKLNLKPEDGSDPEKSGWKLIASVDTRKEEGSPRPLEPGGQYGVSIRDSNGTIGKYRYLLFDMSRTEADDPFGNTFYSELDVIAKDGAGTVADSSERPDGSDRPDSPPFTIRSTDGYCEISIDSSQAPNLKEWVETKLGPALAAWYPKITAMLASEGYEAPKRFTVTLAPGRGVAATGGTRVTANSNWLERELKREAVGAIIHEEVHVVQQYRGGRRNPDFKRPPGWLVEGIPDYIRWFLYEPQSHGADVVWLKGRRNTELKYDARYRVTANFLDYVVNHYDPKKELITKVNAACRQGKYTDDLWQDITGKKLQELDEEWRTATKKELEAAETKPEAPAAKS
ncbi:MAG: hypothetical protein C5B50_29665 [Verrucomicrobia bacterium]|nr:MAG: hypothetical protein C5B50_29665 [Verrucomicrobiota bacterium]